MSPVYYNSYRNYYIYCVNFPNHPHINPMISLYCIYYSVCVIYFLVIDSNKVLTTLYSGVFKSFTVLRVHPICVSLVSLGVIIFCRLLVCVTHFYLYRRLESFLYYLQINLKIRIVLYYRFLFLFLLKSVLDSCK